MTLSGLVAANNLADVTNREKAWDNLGTNISVTWGKLPNLDPDASAYIDAVALADNGYTEPVIQRAINDFVLGCKADGIWTAIKTSCIFAGAGTLAGALVPLKGAALSSTLTGNYNRKTGILRSTGEINTNYPANNNPQDNEHVSAYITTNPSANCRWISTDPNTTATHLEFFNGEAIFRCQLATGQIGFASSTGFLGVSRNASAGYNYRIASSTSFHTSSSAAPGANSFKLLPFAGSPRLAFYSIGEFLNLALLDARANDLITAIGAAS